MNRRVLLLTAWFYPDSVGGTEVYVYTLASKLKSRGFTVIVAAPSRDEKEYNYVYGGLEVYRYPASLPPTKSEITNRTKPQYFEIFTNWLGRIKPDIVHMHSITPGCGLFHARHVKKLGIPLILTMHLPDPICARGTAMRWGKIPCTGAIRPRRCAACYLHKRGLPKQAALMLANVPPVLGSLFGRSTRLSTVLSMRNRILAKRSDFQNLCGLADRVVVVSQWLYDMLHRNNAPMHKVRLSRHGLNSAEFIRPESLRDKEVSDEIKVGYIGRFNPVKGVHVLIEAVKRLPPSFPVRLLLYGRVNDKEEGIYFARLKKIAGKDARISFCEKVTNGDRREIFNDTDIIAVPSVCLETGPLVVLEAHAAGIPVIGSNLGGVAEMIIDGLNGILVEAGNVKAWAKALKKLSSRPQLAKNLARNIPAVRTDTEVALEMAGLYKSILDSKMGLLTPSGL